MVGKTTMRYSSANGEVVNLEAVARMTSERLLANQRLGGAIGDV
jgi:hypothetical protein